MGHFLVRKFGIARFLFLIGYYFVLVFTKTYVSWLCFIWLATCHFKPRSQNDIVLNAAAQSKDGMTYGRCNHPSWDFDRAENKNAHTSLAGGGGAGRFKPCLTLFTLAVFPHPARNTWRKNNQFLVCCSWRGSNLRRWQLTSIISKSICWFLSRRPSDISGFQVQGALLGPPASNCLLRRFYCLE